MAAAQAPSAITGQRLRRRFDLWRARGQSARAAAILAQAGADTAEDVRRLGRAYFEGRPNVGAKTLEELALLAAWPPVCRTAADAIAASLALTISSPEECLDAATDALIGLRRAGFVVTAPPPTGRRSSAGRRE
jgi:hypothetical protein